MSALLPYKHYRFTVTAERQGQQLRGQSERCAVSLESAWSMVTRDLRYSGCRMINRVGTEVLETFPLHRPTPGGAEPDTPPRYEDVIDEIMKTFVPFPPGTLRGPYYGESDIVRFMVQTKRGWYPFVLRRADEAECRASAQAYADKHKEANYEELFAQASSSRR